MPSLEDRIYDTEVKLAEARRSGTEAERVQLSSMLTQLKSQSNWPLRADEGELRASTRFH